MICANNIVARSAPTIRYRHRHMSMPDRNTAFLVYTMKGIGEERDCAAVG